MMFGQSFDNYMAQAMAVGQAQQAYQQQQYAQQVVMYANSQILGSSDPKYTISNYTVSEEKPEPIDPFVQLHNHDFHKLLDKFNDLIK